ncbi:MAG: TRAP transporter large permease subunit, partial [Gemmatimonadetes bacterium]|nr:TRAP transporter large permease subunit [Gemmatimonadota bacterium]
VGMLRGYQGRRAGWRAVASGLAAAGRDSSAILVITAAAGIVIGVFSLTGGAFELSYFLGSLAGDRLGLLLVTTAAASILLGMGMPTVSAYVILASLLAPSLVAAGIGELQAHLFILYFGTLSMLTPPIALAAFVAARIAESGPLRTAWEAMLLSWPAYVVPFLFVEVPALLMSDAASAVLLSFAVSVLGILALTAASAGYLSTRLGIGARVWLGTLGAALLLPVAEWTGVAGAWKAGAAAALLLTLLRLRKTALVGVSKGD